MTLITSSCHCQAVFLTSPCSHWHSGELKATAGAVRPSSSIGSKKKKKIEAQSHKQEAAPGGLSKAGTSPGLPEPPRFPGWKSEVISLMGKKHFDENNVTSEIQYYLHLWTWAANHSRTCHLSPTEITALFTSCDICYKQLEINNMTVDRYFIIISY